MLQQFAFDIKRLERFVLLQSISLAPIQINDQEISMKKSQCVFVSQPHCVCVCVCVCVCERERERERETSMFVSVSRGVCQCHVYRCLRQ